MDMGEFLYTAAAPLTPPLDLPYDLDLCSFLLLEVDLKVLTIAAFTASLSIRR